MKTFTQRDLAYLLAAVESKFDSERERNDNDHEYHAAAIEALERVKAEVTRVIRKWAEPE